MGTHVCLHLPGDAEGAARPSVLHMAPGSMMKKGDEEAIGADIEKGQLLGKPDCNGKIT